MKLIQYTILHLRRMLKNRRVILLSILLPVIVLNITAKITQGQKESTSTQINIDVANEDNGKLGQELIQSIKKISNVDVNENNRETAANRVQRNDVSLALVIPTDFTKSLQDGKEPQVILLKTKDSNADLTLRGTVNAFIGSNLVIDYAQNNQASTAKLDYTKVKELAVKNMQQKNIKTITSLVTKNNEIPLSEAISIGLIVSFMMYTMTFIVGELIELKNNGTLRRSASTPNKNTTILGSVFAAFALVGLIQITLIIASTSILFKVSWGNSIAAIYAVYTALIMVVLSLGILIARFTNSTSQAPMVVSLLVTVTCMVSGCFTPLEYLPEIIKKVALFTPQYWAYTGFKALVLQGKGIAAVLPNIAILILFAAAFFTAGAASLRRIADPAK